MIAALWEITPVSAPRMTQADRWKKRPVVIKTREYRDRLRLLANGLTIPEVFEVIFVMPMPDSWSKKRRSELIGKPHKQKPDCDNLVKNLQDALCPDDSYIWSVKATKVWGNSGMIVLYFDSSDERLNNLMETHKSNFTKESDDSGIQIKGRQGKDKKSTKRD